VRIRHPCSRLQGSLVSGTAWTHSGDVPSAGEIWHMGKDAGGLYEFKKPLNITGRT
jgi:hypothetical protein